jgi:hypothetical protein
MKLLKTSTLALTALFLISACDIINPEEKIASYVYVDLFTLEDNSNVAEGSLDQNITNGQVFVGNEFMGIFTLPALVPVLQEGAVEVQVDPVVKENGRTFTLNLYPFYQRFSGGVELEPGAIDTIQPKTSYLDEFQVGFIEDFELGGTIFEVDRDGNENTFMDVTTEVVYEGNRSGMILLDADNILVDVGTAEDNLFPLGAANEIWMEMNVRSEVDVLIGLVGYDGGGGTASQFEWGVLASDEWSKVYFNLSSEVILSGFNDYGIAITAGIPFENGQLVFDEAAMYFDNIKLLYR